MTKPSSNFALPVIYQAVTEPITPFIAVTRTTLPTGGTLENDWLAVEEPLEISLEYRDGEQLIRRPISITMRTPGDELELVYGFLICEGIINNVAEVADHHIGANKVLVKFRDDVQLNIERLQRHFYTSSSCGVCGKASLEAIRTVCQRTIPLETFKTTIAELLAWPSKLRQVQATFERTGGLHAAGLFDGSNQLVQVCEDVGRHNAVDKLIGHAATKKLLPLHQHGLLVSGRASFELVQKAVMAGFSLMAAVGAPSSLAVNLAKEFDLTLIGFLRDHQFNVYHDAGRIVAS